MLERVNSDRPTAGMVLLRKLRDCIVDEEWQEEEEEEEDGCAVVEAIFFSNRWMSKKTQIL